MPYYFRCDFCHDEQEMSGGMDFSQFRSCDDCGQDGCELCMPDGVCESCQIQREAENEEDGYGL